MTVRNIFNSDTLDELDRRYELTLVSYYASRLNEIWPGRWSKIQLLKWTCPRWRLPTLQGFLINVVFHWNLHAFFRCHKLFTMAQRLAFYKEKHRLRYYFDKQVGSRIVSLFRRNNNGKDLLRDLVYLTPIQKQLRTVNALLVSSTDQAKDQQLIYTFHKIGIPVVALVHSFDNLTSKGLLSTQPDRLLVWNEIMRKEAIDYHGFHIDKVDIVGVPQYETYRKLVVEACESSFRKRLRIPDGTKVITFAGSAIHMFPDEMRFVEDFLSAISRGSCGNTILVMRTHPPDIRKEAYSEKYLTSELPIRLDFPDSGFSALNTGDVGSSQSIREFVELMRYSDVVINLSSTVVLDAILFDTPAICLNFNYLEKEAVNAAHMHHKCEHYHAIVQSNAVDFPNNLEELLRAVNRYLRNPQDKSAERRQLANQIMPNVPTSKLIAEAIDKAIVEHV